MRINGNLEVPDETISGFCKRWKIAEFGLFGSVLREDFRPDSDVDVLVAFEPAAPWSLYDIAVMEEELSAIFHRNTEVIEKSSLRNPFRRDSILRTVRTVYSHE